MSFILCIYMNNKGQLYPEVLLLPGLLLHVLQKHRQLIENNRFVIKRYYQMIEQEVTFLFSTNMLLLNKWNRIISGNHPLSICIKQKNLWYHRLRSYLKKSWHSYICYVYIWKICKEHWNGLASIPKASNRCFVNILLNNCFPSFIPHKLGSQWMYVTRK